MKNIVAIVAGIVFFSLCAVFLLTTIPASGNNATNTVAETPTRHLEAQAQAEKEAKARAELLTQREKEIESRESKLENRAKELDNRSQLLDSRSQELDDKSQVLNTKSRELDDKSQLLDTKSKELTQKEESQAAATVVSGKKKPRIAMVSLYYDNHVDHNQLDIVSLSLRNKLTYAHKHGYTYMFYHNDLVDDSKSPHWSKILVLQHYLEMGEWDWLFWVDLDTLIMNMDIKLEDLVEGVDPQTNLILNNDQNGLNNGVFLVRSCEWSVWYMKQVMEMYPITRNHGFKEQQAQTEVHNRKPETRQHIKWVPQRTMNSYSDGPEERMYQQGDFLIHFAGKSAHDKADFMRRYFDTSYKYPTNLQMWTVKAVPNPE